MPTSCSVNGQGFLVHERFGLKKTYYLKGDALGDNGQIVSFQGPKLCTSFQCVSQLSRNPKFAFLLPQIPLVADRDVQSSVIGNRPKSQARHGHKDRGKNNLTQKQRREKHQAVHAAARKSQKNHVPVRITYPFVFVGNLRPGVTKAKLQEFFAHCGETGEIAIRCSHGNVVTVRRTVDSELMDLWYASIVFREVPSAQKALDMNGAEFDGRKIVVTKFAGELPEILRIAQARFGEMQEKMGLPNQYRRIDRPSDFPAFDEFKKQRCQRVTNKIVITKSPSAYLTMAQSGALNPASMPFFPGALRGVDEDGLADAGLGFRHTFREQDRTSLSISSAEYRSAHSSPSPPVDQNPDSKPKPFSEFQERPRQIPPVRQADASKPYPVIESRILRESSMVGALDTLHEGDDHPITPGPTSGGTENSGVSFFSPPQQSRDPISTLPISVNHNGASFYGGRTSSSPVSSLDSGSHFIHSLEASTSFEAQLMASPLIQDILNRLLHCEIVTKELHRDMIDVQQKSNHLIDRSANGASQPEFKDPFAPANSNGHNFPSPPLNGSRMNPRPSLGNIAPNQIAPSDDMSSISQRLNTLTSSVGQLLAIQTQIHSNNTELRSNSIVAMNNHHDVAPNQPIPPSNTTNLGPGLPMRPEMRPMARQPNPPMRTWSAGNLDLPMRPPDLNVGRQENIMRDKRRSVTGLFRRDSSGVLDPQGDTWAGGSPRDSGPMISKWEQLSLAPELLRSLTKFGIGPPNKIQQRALPFLLRGSDIIAQAPPTQERIAAYVIPAIQIAVANITSQPNRGPIVIMVSTTVDQATQAQRMIRDLGGPIGVRSALGVGASAVNADLSQELRLLQQNMPHIICGTPQKLHLLFTSPGGLSGAEVRFLVLDEVDQLIARNLHDFVFNIVKLLPPPRSRPIGTPNSATPSNSNSFNANNVAESSGNVPSSFPNQVRRFSTVSVSSSTPSDATSNSSTIERQTALFSNTVPQDVLNLASAIQLREPVRVLVRRDGNITHTETNQGSRGLRQYYLYLAFTASGRPDPNAIAPGGGLGIIGSGRGSLSTAETAQAREWKLDALADLFDDTEVTQAIVFVGGMNSLDSVVYKLASRGLEAIPLHGDMNAGTKLAALNKFRQTSSLMMRPIAKVLVVYDIQVKSSDISHVPLVINYDLPKAVEEYAHRVAPAIASNYSRAGVVVNFVTATGGDVEMLRSIECFYKIKCPEVPMSLRDIV
ncbi:hypothetical protein H0H93_005406 [Arthromyces matolae]|nr:hypothetical protein H0H93_005406 [Arthromyces matolae]